MIRYGSRTVSLEHTLDEFAEVLSRAPVEAAFELRNFVGRAFGRWRRHLNKQLPKWAKKLERRGAFTYSLRPSDRENKRKTNRSLSRISGEFRTRSRVVLAHEFGALIRPRKGQYLAVPIGKYGRMSTDQRRAEGLRSPAQYNRRNPSNPLVVLRRKRRGSAGAILARPTGRKLKSGKPQMQGVFVLKRSVTVKPSLGMFRVWDSLADDRTKLLQEHINRVAQALIQVKRVSIRRAA